MTTGRLLLWIAAMVSHVRKSLSCCAIFLATLLLAEPAAAFRCGSKLVKDGMHEQQVIAACGEPTARRHLGYALRSFGIGSRGRSPGWTGSYFPGHGSLSEEVLVTEYVYNFGPRKLMRRLLFEGGILVSIETIGYGYNEKAH